MCQVKEDKIYYSFILAICATIVAVALSASVAYAAPPDSRIYELASPVQKSGGIGGVFPLGSLTHSLEQFARPLQSSSDGSTIAYEGEDFYHPHLGSLNQYLSMRGSEGWLTQNLTPGVPFTTEPTAEANPYVGFSPSLSIGIVSSEIPLAEGVPAGYANLYIAQGNSFQPLLTVKPPNRSPATFGHAKLSRHVIVPSLLFAGGNEGNTVTPAFSHLLFVANDALTEDAAAGEGFKNNLYVWINGSLQLVNVLPDGKTEPGASFGVDNGDEYNNKAVPSLSHVISANGSRIFWTDENNGNLYVREDGMRTVQVDAAVGGNGEFQTASFDGSRVFFIKSGHLDEYNTDSGATTYLTKAGGVGGMVGASDDGTYVYFVAESVLAKGAANGQPNLYLSHELSSHERILNFIATLSPNDNQTTEIYGAGTTPEGDWYHTFAGRTAEVSPDGRYVAFMSERSLTGYNNADAIRIGHDYELFLYDSVTASLVCASCNTDESQPTSSTLLPAPVDGIYQQRYLDDAGRLFFSTKDPVLSQDTNGVSDVYEYEGGRVYLVSPGDASDEAVFADASESGDDVFFTTRQQLVPADGDQIVDMYDARVGGEMEGSRAVPCSSEVCHEAPSAPSSFGPSASAVFEGAANLVPPPEPVKPKPVPLTRARKLANGLKACRVRRNLHRRAACEARVRKRY